MKGIVLIVVGLVAMYASAAANSDEHIVSDRPTLVIMGASYAAGWGVPESERLHIINKGIGGHETHHMLARFEQDVLATDADALLLWGFLNNIYRAPEGKMAETKVTALEDLKAMIEMAQAQGMRVFVATEVSIRHEAGFKNSVMYTVGGWMGKDSYQDYINSQVAEVNAQLRAYAESRNIPVLDFFAQLSDEDGYRKATYATPDGSHLTEAAYARLTAYAVPLLEQYLTKQGGGDQN